MTIDEERVLPSAPNSVLYEEKRLEVFDNVKGVGGMGYKEVGR